MKKHFLLTAFIVLGLISCTNEGTAANTVASMKTPQMENYDKAFKSLGDPQNRPTEEERKRNTTELSGRRKALLVPASKELILSTGVTESELMRRTGGDMSQIIVWATQIYMQKSDEIRKNIKTEN
jgi:flagellar motor protein MotB